MVELSTAKLDVDIADKSSRFFATSAIEPEAISFAEYADGRYVALVRIDARRMPAARLHFASLQLPEGAELFVYTAKRGEAPVSVLGPYTGVGPLDGSDFWTEAVPGGTIVIELQVRGEVTALLPFEIDLVERLDRWTAAAEPGPAKVVERRVSVVRGQVIEHEVVDGQGVFEGDILLGSLVDLESAAAGSGNGKGRSKSALGQTATYYRWPNGVIPYVIESTVPSVLNVTAAISHWNTALPGVIQLVPRTNQTDYVRFAGGSGCFAYVGRTGGAQPIQLATSCAIGNIIHEIGHTVGLYHEQSREDRNSWVVINKANVSSASLYNFDQAPAETDDLIYYAYNSIMHYHATAFSSNGLPTIDTLPAGIPIGQRTGLDVSDIAAVRKMYNKQTSAVAVSTVPTGVSVVVDGVSVVTPATFNWTVGSVHTISAATTIPKTAPSQYVFVRWSDAGAMTHAITVPATGLTVAATYALGHKLEPIVATAGTGTTASSPASPDLYYAQGAKVTLTATPKTGYCFSTWSGLAAGTPNQTSLSMTKSLAPKATFITGAITPAATAVSIPAAGGTFTMDTVATTGCGWSIKPSTTWVTVSKVYATSSSPNFSYTVQPNTSGVARTAYIAINGKNVAISQAK